MKEFIEKLIDRLRGQIRIVREYEHSAQYEPKETEVIDYEDIVEIVNQLAEEYKPKTNADKIRAMTDEELAEFLDDGVPNCADYCPDFKEGCAFGCKYKQDKDFLVLWLQSEAE